MHRILAALFLSLGLAIPATAHADSFQYTIVDNIPLVAPGNYQFLPYVGTYTFTVSSLLTGTTFVYGPNFTDTPFTGYPYIYASDFTVPSSSPVDQIMIIDDPLSHRWKLKILSDSQVPEPSTITLLSLGAIGIATQFRRRITQSDL